MKKLLSVVIVLAMGIMLFGCPKPPPAEPEVGPSDAEVLEQRAEPEVTDEPGLQDEPGEVEELPQIDLQRVHFDTDKWSIREDAREILKQNARAFQEYPDLILTIEGHCDERNTVEYNLALGERRAASTRDYLIKLGVDASRIKTISYGEERPMATGHDESSWWQNRRSEFKIGR